MPSGWVTPLEYRTAACCSEGQGQNRIVKDLRAQVEGALPNLYKAITGVEGKRPRVLAVHTQQQAPGTQLAGLPDRCLQ